MLKSGYLRQGPRTEQFEEEFRKKVGARYAYAINSGTAALHVACLSILKPNDEVIVPDFTFMSTASTVIFAGGRPVFADIEGETLTTDPEDVGEKVTPRTRAIVPVHLLGNAADMRALREIAEDHNLYLVSDAAQAHGTRIDGEDVGSLDNINCYSFYPTKTITTGEGGMATMNDEELCEKEKLIRNHGQESQYLHRILGFNYRMTEIAAVLGLSQLEMLDGFLEKRRRNAGILTEGLRGIHSLRPQQTGRGVEHSYSYYTIIMELEKFRCDRDKFVEALKAENVDCMVYYPIPLMKQPALRDFAGKIHCLVAEETSEKVFSVPVHPSLAEQDLENILAALDKVSSNYLK